MDIASIAVLAVVVLAAIAGDFFIHLETRRELKKMREQLAGLLHDEHEQ